MPNDEWRQGADMWVLRSGSKQPRQTIGVGNRVVVHHQNPVCAAIERPPQPSVVAACVPQVFLRRQVVDRRVSPVQSGSTPVRRRVVHQQNLQGHALLREQGIQTCRGIGLIIPVEHHRDKRMRMRTACHRVRYGNNVAAMLPTPCVEGMPILKLKFVVRSAPPRASIST